MKQLGTALIILGLLLIIFNIAGCQSDGRSSLVDWMDKWGTGVGWAIKIGMVVLGIILVAVADRKRQ